MKRLTLFVSGKVQHAGYRDRVIELCRGLGLTGYAENLPDGRVKVVAEGNQDKLGLLEEVASIKNSLINVENIESSFSEATGEFSGFFKLVRGGETDERLDVAADLLKELIEVTRGGFSETVSAIKSVKSDTSAMLEKQDSMLEKQDSMLEKQDSMLEKQDSMLGKQDSMLEKQDSMLEKQDKTIRILENVREDTSEMKSTLSRIEVDVKDTKISLSSFIEEKYRKMEGEIAEIKATLARMQEAV